MLSQVQQIETPRNKILAAAQKAIKEPTQSPEKEPIKGPETPFVQTQINRLNAQQAEANREIARASSPKKAITPRLLPPPPPPVQSTSTSSSTSSPDRASSSQMRRPPPPPPPPPQPQPQPPSTPTGELFKASLAQASSHTEAWNAEKWNEAANAMDELATPTPSDSDFDSVSDSDSGSVYEDADDRLSPLRIHDPKEWLSPPIPLLIKHEIKDLKENIKTMKDKIDNTNDKTIHELHNRESSNNETIKQNGIKITKFSKQQDEIKKQLDSKENTKSSILEISRKIKYFLKENNIGNFEVEYLHKVKKDCEDALQGFNETNKTFINAHDTLEKTRETYKTAQEAYEKTLEASNTQKDQGLEELEQLQLEELEGLNQEIETLKKIEEECEKQLNSANKAKEIQKNIDYLLELNKETTELEEEQEIQNKKFDNNKQEIETAYSNIEKANKDNIKLKEPIQKYENLRKELLHLTKEINSLEEAHLELSSLKKKLASLKEEFESLEKKLKPLLEELESLAKVDDEDYTLFLEEEDED